MRKMFLLAFMALAVQVAVGASAQPPAALKPELTPLVTADKIHSGWRAGALIGEPVESNGKMIGRVQDIVVDYNGQVLIHPL